MKYMFNVMLSFYSVLIISLGDDDDDNGDDVEIEEMVAE